MIVHTMTFDNFGDKSDAEEYIRDVIEPDDLDLYFTQKKLTFTTACDLTKHQRASMLKHVTVKSYKWHDL